MDGIKCVRAIRHYMLAKLKGISINFTNSLCANRGVHLLVRFGKFSSLWIIHNEQTVDITSALWYGLIYKNLVIFVIFLENGAIALNLYVLHSFWENVIFLFLQSCTNPDFSANTIYDELDLWVYWFKAFCSNGDKYNLSTKQNLHFVYSLHAMRQL